MEEFYRRANIQGISYHTLILISKSPTSERERLEAVEDTLIIERDVK